MLTEEPRPPSDGFRPKADIRVLLPTHTTTLVATPAGALLAFLMASLPLWAQGDEPAAARTKGSYILVRDLALDSTCTAYRDNLNATAEADFSVCHSRLTAAHPRFARVEWTEVPLDLAIAKKIVLGIIPKVAPQKAETTWQKWLTDTEQWRLQAKASMWRARLDIDGNGEQETVVRLTPAFTNKLSKGDYCAYTNSYVQLLEANAQMLENFNSRSVIGDLILDAETKRYLLVQRSSEPTIGSGIWLRGHPTWLKKASGGVAIYKIVPTWGPVAVCNIQWVPRAASKK